MKTPKIPTLSQAIFSIEESRLIYLEKKSPSTSPAPATGQRQAPDATPAARPASRPNQAQNTNRLKQKVRGKAADLLKKWKKMKADQHTPEFQALIREYIKRVQSGLQTALRDKNIQKSVKKFGEKMKLMAKKITVALALDKAKKALSDKKFKEMKSKITAEVLEKVPDSHGKLKPAIKASIEKFLGEMQSEIQKRLGALGTRIIKAKTGDLGQITAEINKFPNPIPQKIDVLTKAVKALPQLKKILEEMKEYLEALKYIYNTNLMTTFLGQCRIEGNCGKTLKEWEKKVKTWAKFPGKMPKGKKLVDAVLRAQTRIIMAQVLDMLKNQKYKSLREKLVKALKKIPGAIQNNEIQIEAVLKFLQRYDSFQNVGAEAKRKVAQLLAKAIGAVTRDNRNSGLNIDMIVEGGADSQAIAFRERLKSKYSELQKVAKRLINKVKKGKGLRALPQVKAYEAELKAFKEAKNAYEFLESKANDSKKRKKWFGAGGVLNVLLFISRAEDMAGELGSQDNLFENGNCRVGGSATAQGRPKAADRFSRINFVARKANLRQSTLPPSSAAPSAASPGTSGSTTQGGNPKKSSTTTPQGSNRAGRQTPQAPTQTSTQTPTQVPTQAPTQTSTQTPTQAPATPRISTVIPTPNKGKAAEYLGVAFRKTADGKKFLIVGNRHALTEEEFRIVVGEKRPTEAYKKMKVRASYVRTNIPQKVEYEADKKLITGTYTYGSNTITITYDIKTGERKADLKGNLKPLLPQKPEHAATKMAVIRALLADGLDISKLQITEDPQEKSKKDLKEKLKDEKWEEVLRILLANQSQDIELIAICIKKIGLDKVDFKKAFNNKKAILRELLKFYEGGPISAKAIEIFPNDEVIAAYYLETAFDKQNKDINIKALKAYTGPLIRLGKEVIAFINSNYKKDFKTKQFKERIYTALVDEDVSKFKRWTDLFEKLFPNTDFIEGLARKPGGPEVWGKYRFATDKKLMETNIDQLFIAGSSDMLEFIDAWAEITRKIEVGAVNANNKNKAINILKRISASNHPVVIKATEELLAAIKKLKGLPNQIITSIEDGKQKRMKRMFEIATGKNKDTLWVDDRVTALKMFISGPYKDEDVRGVKGGGQGANRLNRMKKTLAEVYYENARFEATELTDALKILLSKTRQEFLKHLGGDLNSFGEAEMQFVIKHAKEITVPAIKALARKLEKDANDDQNGFVKSAGQALRLYKFIGMKEKAAEMLVLIKDEAEKAFLRTMLDYMDKGYKDLTTEQKRKVKKGLIQAYKAISTGSSGNKTAFYVQMQIIEEMYKLSEHLKSRGKEDILKLLDTKANSANGYLNILAEQPYSPRDPNNPTYKDRLILRAKELRVKVKVELAKPDFDNADINELAESVENYIEALGKKRFDIKYAEILKKVYIKKGTSISNNAKKALAMVMLRAAEQSKDKTYLVGGFGNANLNIQADDFNEDTEKVRYYIVLGKYLEAAKLEKDKKKKMSLIARSKAKPEKKAAAYEQVDTADALYKAAELYIKSAKYNKAAATLEKKKSKKFIITKTKAERLIKQMPNIQIKINLAVIRDLKKLAFETFAKTSGADIDIKALMGTGAPSLKEIIDALKQGGREVRGDIGSRSALFSILAINGSYTSLTAAQQKSIKKSLGL